MWEEVVTEWYGSKFHSLWVTSHAIEWYESMVQHLDWMAECVCHACILVVYAFGMHVGVYVFVMHALLWSWFSCMRSWYEVGIVMHEVDILL